MFHPERAAGQCALVLASAAGSRQPSGGRENLTKFESLGIDENICNNNLFARSQHSNVATAALTSQSVDHKKSLKLQDLDSDAERNPISPPIVKPPDYAKNNEINPESQNLRKS